LIVKWKNEDGLQKISQKRPELKNLSEEQIWRIHEQTRTRWGEKRDLNLMAPISSSILENALTASNG